MKTTQNKCKDSGVVIRTLHSSECISVDLLKFILMNDLFDTFTFFLNPESRVLNQIW